MSRSKIKQSIDKATENEIKLISSSKEDLPELIEAHKIKLKEHIVSFMKENDLNQVSELQILDVMSKGVAMSRTRYSDLELAIAFEIYKEIVTTISTIDIRYVPTIQKFCMYIGISTQTFGAYLTNEDPDMREVATKIDDYLTAALEEAAMRNRIPYAMGMFQLETKHKYVKQKESIGITVEINNDVAGIKDKLNKLDGKIIEGSYEEK